MGAGDAMEPGKREKLEKLEEIEKRVLAELKPFQASTVKRVGKLFRTGKNRVLVADEVGLGKTLVARGVIATTARMERTARETSQQAGRPLFKVAYICSNGAIANQNLAKLNIDRELVDHVNPGESRLSMQHLLAYENEKRALELGRCIQLIPLTPGTSFYLTRGCGIVQERALIYEVLRRHALFEGCHKELSSLLRNRVNDGTWDYFTGGGEGSYRLRIENAGDEYWFRMLDALEPHEGELTALRDALLADPSANSPGIIRGLRGVFARLSASSLDPDLVIMDEFQRFRDLLDENRESELGILAERFLRGRGQEGSSARVLLLSATPFKFYSTAAEDDSFFGSESQADFLRVVGFLAANDEEKRAFAETWGHYGRLLAHLGKEGGVRSPSFKAAREKAEAALRELVARSERATLDECRDLVRDCSAEDYVDLEERDVASFLACRRLMADFGVQQSFPPAYTESCPYLLSYLKGYKLGDKLERAVRSHQSAFRIRNSNNEKAKLLWLSFNAVRDYRKLNVPNSRFVALQNDVFETGAKGYDASSLLWVPPTMPYYRVDEGPYAGASGFSKVLVFSSWVMVPRMMSTLLSYEDERRSLERKYGSRKIPFTYFARVDTGEEDNGSGVAKGRSKKEKLPSGRLRFQAETRGPVCLIYPSPALALAVNWAELGVGRNLDEVRALVAASLESKLADAGVMTGGDKVGEADLRWVLKACFLLDGQCVAGYAERLIASIESRPEVSSTMKKALGEWRAIDRMDFSELGARPIDLAERLAEIALGSPAVCALRLFERCEGWRSEEDPALAFRFAYAFVRKLNTPASTLTIDGCYPTGKAGRSFWELALDYCVQGNLQAVLEEYGHLLGFNRSAQALCEQMIGESTSTFRGPSLYTMQSSYDVDTLASFRGKVLDDCGPSEPMRMRTEFAAAFMEDEGGGRNANRRESVRRAFNSPFRPFVLVSTSIGQEGLDFHAYCRKVVHWNLPSNPIDLEQREGRVNRYDSLALRQNLVAKENASFATRWDDIWEELFREEERRGAEAGGRSAGLVPHWGLCSYDSCTIERHVYLRQLGKEEARYRQLVDALVRYRAVLGMPRQEELLALLAAELTDEEIRELFINLCPFAYEETE